MGPAYKKGMILLRQRRYRDAADQFQSEIGANPSSAESHVMLALSLLNDDKPGAAIVSAEEGLCLNPSSAFAHYVLSLILLRIPAPVSKSMWISFFWKLSTPQRLARAAVAKQSLDKAIELNPFEPDYLAQLSVLFLHLGKWRASLQAAEAGLQLNPNHVGCAHRRVLSLLLLFRRRDAMAEATRILNIDPENAQAHATLGWLSFSSDRRQKAVEHFQNSLRVNPENEVNQAGLRRARRPRIGILADPDRTVLVVAFAISCVLSANIFEFVCAHWQDTFRRNSFFMVALVAADLLLIAMMTIMLRRVAGRFARRAEESDELPLKNNRL